MILLNGRPADGAELMDRGLHYGDGVFETVAVVAGRPRFWHAHLERLNAGCQRLGIPAPASGLLEQDLQILQQEANPAVIKILVTRGAGGRGYRAPAQPTPQRILYAFPPADAGQPNPRITVRLCATRLGLNPALAGLKHLNRLEQVLARSEWDDPAVAEGLMLDAEGYVVEGTMSNVFLRHSGILTTPALDRCGVQGIMRGWVLRQAERLGLDARIDRVTLDEVRDADEVFMTNAVVGIWPVERFESTSYPKFGTGIELGRLLHEQSYGQADI